MTSSPGTTTAPADADADAAAAADPAAVTVSAELFAPVSPDVELCYQTFGSPDDEPLLLVMGLGGPMTWWDEDLCRMLARDGFYVVRFDNRDAGRSSRARGRVGRTTLVRGFLGLPARTPYAMADLAADAVGLLDHLGLDSAHVAGVSMGGMIGQTLAVDHADRVRSLTSIMSSTGRRFVGFQHPSLFPTLLTRSPGRDGYVRASLATWRLIGSPAYPSTLEDSTARALATFDRGVSASGLARQMAAIVTQPDRTRALREVDVPVSVLHGTADRMVHVSGGRSTAAAVPQAELTLVRGMGHDMPPALFGLFSRTIRRTADRAITTSA
ncbi:MAG: alpha/beta hydrolase [Nocardioides sp.]|nr:alpha/beta hydrolase [Nocardioides sp.]